MNVTDLACLASRRNSGSVKAGSGCLSSTGAPAGSKNPIPLPSTLRWLCTSSESGASTSQNEALTGARPALSPSSLHTTRLRSAEDHTGARPIDHSAWHRPPGPARPCPARARALTAPFAGEGPGEFVAGVDVQLLVDVPEVILHGLGAQEQRGRGFPCCPPARQGQRDLQLLRGQLVDRARIPPQERLAGGREFGARPAGPWTGAETLEDVQRGPKLLAGEHPVPGTPQALAVGQPGPRRLEGIQGLRVLAYCLVKNGGELAVGREQSLGAQRAGERPWLPLRLGRGGELGGGLLGRLLAAEAQVSLGE